MRHSLTILFAIIGIIFITIGAQGRYRVFLAFARIMQGSNPIDYETLRAENNALKTALMQAKVDTSFARQENDAIIFADVFALYPFNGYKIVRIDKGLVDGMRIGYPATFGGSVLVGQVTDVRNTYSIVRIVGSPDWQIPVRVGPHKIAGLLVGGTVPRITMIPADKNIAVGDAVISASSELPYGLTIGTVSTVSATTEGGVFKDAGIAFPYDTRDIAELAFMVWKRD